MVKFIIGDTMKILLFNNRLYTLDLPAKIDGSFALQDIPNSEEILANIEEKNNKWVMASMQDYKISYKNSMVQSVELTPNEFYILTSGKSKKLIYADESVDNTFKIYKVNDNSQFVIGKNANNQISYNNNFVLGQHLALIFSKGVWKFKLAPNASLYLNKTLITSSEHTLKNGDVIFIYGLKIILMGNLIMINNPGGKVTVTSQSLSTFTIHQEKIKYQEVQELDLYSENDFFFKTPRLRRFIETYNLSFANPPQMNDNKEMPLLLVLGPSLTMGITSVVTLVTTIMQISSGKIGIGQAIPRLLTTSAMMLGSFLWPNLTKKYNKKRKLEENQLRTDKYHEYIEKKKQEIIAEAVNQTQILKENLLQLEECYQIIVNRKRTLWERKISQRDFLTIRVGTGDVPVDMNINFNDDEFKIEEDPLKEEAIAMIEQNKKLLKVPVGYSLYNKKAVAVMGINDKLHPFINNVILQLITFHSYDDLKIVIFTDKKNEAKWEIYKNLPHCFSNNKSIRFFATDIDEIKTVSTYLEQEWLNRANGSKAGDTVENEDKNVDGTYSPYYLIFTDCFSKVRRLNISDMILSNKENFGFGYIILENSLGKLPSECVDFITIGNQTSGILSNHIDDYFHQDFNDEINTNIDMEKCSQVLANIPIEFYEDNRYLPKSLGFLEMQRVGKVEQLNSLNRWRLNDPTKSLRAAIGVNDLGNMIYLDLHEKFHGPHGLIAGTTGSGKSEFIITYILSMALNYSPNEVSFILIDYKGGGLAGAFENKTKNIRLPHLAGTITNLDKASLNRTLVSIDSELRRRQKVFNEAREKLGESTIDIYKYQKFFRQKKLTEPIPHLFIISDEFAELKAQQPEFMDNLISAARIGRSLGVHLILATQKPSGVVNDQIWSNTKFRVCLKVQDRSDSNEMLKKPDAAEIKEAGRFYLQVGNDELYILGQSGWCGTQYVPSDTVNTEVDHSINYLDNVGSSIKDYDGEVVQTKVSSLGDELSNVLKYITDLAKRENVQAPQLWLDNIPETIYTESLIKKYNYTPTPYKLEAIIGEYDDPSNQRQGLLKLELGNNGNTIIYGTSSSNREMFLNTLIYSLCITHSSDEVNIYAFDFGSESLRMFQNMPHVGDIVFASEDDKISKLNKMIKEEIIKRKKLFAEYNGEYENYCKNSGNSLPKKIFIYNNLDSYKEMYPNCDEELVKISREGLRYGIIIIITAGSSSGLYSRLLRNFENVFTLDMQNADAYTAILGKIGKTFPADFEGRGLFKGELVYEYQTAQIYPKDNLLEFIKRKIVEIKAKNPNKAESIPVLPDVVTIDMLKEDDLTLKKFPLGLNKDTLKKEYWNFEGDKATVVTSNDMESIVPFVNSFMDVSKLYNNLNTVVIDPEKIIEKYASKPNIYISDNLVDNVKKLIEEINNDTNSIFIIYGLEKFKASLEATDFTNFMAKMKECGKIKLLFIETQFKLKKFAFEGWYSENVVNINGIWVGNGVMDQGVIRISDLNTRYKIKVNNTFAWLIKNGIGELVKFAAELGDDNEK